MPAQRCKTASLKSLLYSLESGLKAALASARLPPWQQHHEDYKPERRHGSVQITSGSIETKPHVIFRLTYGPSNYRGANNKNYVRANDHDGRANKPD